MGPKRLLERRAAQCARCVLGGDPTLWGHAVEPIGGGGTSRFQGRAATQAKDGSNRGPATITKTRNKQGPANWSDTLITRSNPAREWTSSIQTWSNQAGMQVGDPAHTLVEARQKLVEPARNLSEPNPSWRTRPQQFARTAPELDQIWPGFGQGWRGFNHIWARSDKMWIDADRPFGRI